ncbi:class I SAM-dependent methyltransferase [Tardiphaga sp.]|uniref:class I SAM-dependent methyltransferase n=1 Tax=Tardiphaga sp. TaxID=1926292 RepID=UPI002630D809|nr:class I SAM-dependent methyltransferase [Tardiphaga sp.]MDB5618906.1 type 11 methyltransferase [Tardiphaga sp.]
MLVFKLDKLFYPGVEDGWDDLAFRQFILRRVTSDLTILDLGAGQGRIDKMNFRGLARKVCGVDPDARVAENPHLDEALVGVGERIPYGPATFDMVFADNVLEHLVDPKSVFIEISRILKPGGRFVFKTPNKLHYMPFIARITPHWFHAQYNAWRGRSEEDTFPTVYRSNTPDDVARYARSAGLHLGEFELIESRPEYLRIGFIPYLFGIVYERVVNRFLFMRRFRVVMIGELIKPIQ